MKLMVGRIGGAVLAFAALVPPSEAQEVLQSPDAIRACLCQEQAVASLSAALRQDSESYDARQNELRALDERIETARRQDDPTDFAARGQLGQLLDQRDAARNRLAEATPRHSEIASRYNGVAAGFNQQCAGKAYNAEVMASVRATLACPAVIADPTGK